MNNRPQQILPYDDEYILVRKRRFLSSTIAIASMGKYISAINNRSLIEIVDNFAQGAASQAESMSSSEVESQILNAINASKKTA
ncbi:hypothetical protein ACSQ6I_03715 [Anabaena sp. WFMT]|uniref:hypothetical protein n=1 Tax=Anabaena sp. WFMT TaxID=3449730 RepID=UPI003F23936A